MAGLLDHMQANTLDLPIMDAVYDASRDLLYVTVPSAPTHALNNSLVSINPATGQIVAATPIGQSPNKLAIAADHSRVYVGLDGDSAVRWWNPSNGELGTLRPVIGSALDLAVPPANPNLVVISQGQLEQLSLVSDSEVKPVGFSVRSSDISFADANNLIAFNYSNTGFELKRWSFDGSSLTLADERGDVVDLFNVEAEASSDGHVYFTDGRVVDSTTLEEVDRFFLPGSDTARTVENAPAIGLTYFVTRPDNIVGFASLYVYDRATQLQLDVESLPMNALSTRGQLITAGANRLALVARRATPDNFNNLTIIRNVPVASIPEPAPLALSLIAGILPGHRLRSRRGQ